jgi:hypothetical protein
MLDKIMAGVASLAMFLFSSYTGNDPGFEALRGYSGKKHLQLTTRLVSAFENDFPDVFKSGSLITVNFTVEIRSKGRVVATHNFSNSVQYDTRQGSYSIRRSNSGRRLTTDSYRDMVREISGLDCALPIQQDWGMVDVRVEAWLPTVHFAQIDKDVDLMVLWKLQRPSVRGSFFVQYAS